MRPDDFFIIGYIYKTKGFKGHVEVIFEVDNPEAYLKIGHFFIDIKNRHIPYFIRNSSFQKNNCTAVILFEDVESPEEASTIVHKHIWMPIKDKKKNSEEEFPSFKELKGFLVEDFIEGTIGEIQKTEEYPQQIIASVIYKNNEVLFPLNDVFVKEIDAKNKIIKTCLPEGLLDIYTSKNDKFQ